MNEQDVLGAFLLVNNPIVLSEEETKDVQKAIKKLQQENKQLKEKLDKYENPEDMTLFAMWCTEKVKEENKQLKDKLSKIETLIINHNCDTGDIYYKYNSKFVKSELKQRILEILEDKDMLGLKEESEELKKQLTTYKILHRDCKVDNLKNISKIEEMENQQKEFIEYLENESILHPQYGEYTYYGYRRKIIGEILSKYKEIIGVSNENNIK